MNICDIEFNKPQLHVNNSSTMESLQLFHHYIVALSSKQCITVLYQTMIVLSVN